MTLPLSEIDGELPIPRLHHRPPQTVRPGHQEAVELIAACGVQLDPVQQFCLELAMGERADGTWAADTFDMLISRQNGKNELAIARELFGLAVLGETIVHSAHHFKTTKKSYKRLRDMIRKLPDVERLVVDEHKSSAGGWDILFANGGQIEFLARGSAGSGRGFDAVDLLVLDEAQELKDDMLGDVMPVVSAVPNHQIWQFGTAPDETQTFWQRKRYRGRRQLDPRTAYVEVSADPDAEIDDRRAWRQANFALVYGRMTEETILSELGNLSPDVFALERLSISPELLEGGALYNWSNICDPDVYVETAACFGLDCNPERTHAAIVAAGQNTVEVVNYDRGVSWVVDRCVELRQRYRVPIVLDASGPAAAFLEELERRRVRVTALPAQDMTRACGRFIDLVNTPETPFRARQNRDLTSAVNGAVMRSRGDTMAWGRTASTVDISPLVAATAAAFVAERTGRPRVVSVSKLLAEEEATDGIDR